MSKPEGWQHEDNWQAAMGNAQAEHRFVTCPLCHDPERPEDMVAGVCLTCADAIAFAQNARRGATMVPTTATFPRWECSSCRRNADSCARSRCCAECDHDPADVEARHHD